MKRIKVRLSSQSVGNALNCIKQYQNELPNKAARLVQILAAQGESIARFEAASIRMTGNLINSICHETQANVGCVAVKCDYAVFVEFGTGVVGKGSPHPDVAILGWCYDVNSHGELGWWYPTDESDTNPTKKRTEDDVLIAWTKGMPSRPFMFNTAEQLKQLVIPAARSVFA